MHRCRLALKSQNNGRVTEKKNLVEQTRSTHDGQSQAYQPVSVATKKTNCDSVDQVIAWPAEIAAVLPS